jgi:hypothetical protein
MVGELVITEVGQQDDADKVAVALVALERRRVVEEANFERMVDLTRSLASMLATAEASKRAAGDLLDATAETIGSLQERFCSVVPPFESLTLEDGSMVVHAVEEGVASVIVWPKMRTN